jgi:hypothetical protein
MKMNSMYKICALIFGLLADMQVRASAMDLKLDEIRQSLEDIADRMHQKGCTKNCPASSECSPRLYLAITDDSLRKSLYNALMAGIFIDDFTDPLSAAYTVGLANKIYALQVDENNKLRSPSAPLPLSCSPDGLEKPYNDLKNWAKEEFSTNKLVGKTAQELLNQVVDNDGFLRSLSDRDYHDASVFWGAHKLKQGAGALPTASQDKLTPVRQKIEAFQEKNRLEKQIQNVPDATDS